MAVTDFVTFQIQVANAGLAQEGFGTPLIVAYDATFPDRVRVYGSIADIAADFTAGGATYQAANALFSQVPRPVEVKVGRGDNKPTMQYTLGAIVVNNSYKYALQVDGPGITSTEVDYTSDSTATKQEIHNGLVAGLNAVPGKNYTATFSPIASFSPTPFTVADQPTGKLTIAGHPFNTGDGPVQLTTTGSLPTGLLTVTNYWIIKFDANTIQLATSLANALAGTPIVLSSNGTGTNDVTDTSTLSPILPFLVTASAPGNWFSVAVLNSTIISNKMTHADPGVTADLNTIQAADDDWYGLVTTSPSKAMTLAEAAWVESEIKIYMPSFPETDAQNTATGNGDTGDVLFGFGYKRTDAKYHPSPVQMFSPASMGIVIPRNPGTWTEAFKTLVGVAPVKMTPTQRTNLKARRMGSYTTEKGRNITWDGKVGSTVYGYLDITVALDWLADSVSTAALGVLVALDKVAYTDEDIDTIAGAIRGVLHDAVSDAHRILDPGDPNDPTNLPPSITFPKVADIDPSVRALRELPDGVITGRLQGAIQSIAFSATVTF